jgi:hypothetical protein
LITPQRWRLRHFLSGHLKKMGPAASAFTLKAGQRKPASLSQKPAKTLVFIENYQSMGPRTGPI